LRCHPRGGRPLSLSGGKLQGIGRVRKPGGGDTYDASEEVGGPFFDDLQKIGLTRRKATMTLKGEEKKGGNPIGAWSGGVLT